jgi:hypothetical protein
MEYLLHEQKGGQLMLAPFVIEKNQPLSVGVQD